jgi:signal transduction histidine kinase
LARLGSSEKSIISYYITTDVTSMNFKIKSVIGFLIITAVIFVYSLFVDEMKKIPLNYELISEHEGQDRILESIGGKLSEPFWIREVLKENIVNVNGNILEINSTVVGRDSATNHIIFSNANTFFVDRATRKHQSMGEYFTFPPNVQKRNYEFFHPMIFTKTPFIFEREAKINGLDVYDFSCQYNGTDVSSAFPQFPSKTIFSNGTCTISVEPVTGMVVSFSKQWDDYFVNNGIRGNQVELGGKYTTDYSKTILVNNAKSTKALYYLLDSVFPSLIVIIGIVILFVVFLFDKTKNQAKIIVQTQKDLIKKEKLSAIGELTARISHDLRNPLTIMTLTIQNIHLKISNNIDPKIEEQLPILNDAVSMINHQINQVMGFVKTTSLDIKLVSISKVLENSIKNINIPKNISVTLPENDFSLLADRIQLSVAFSNILSNSVDAIGAGEGRIVIRAINGKNNLILEFEDSGDGISEENIKKIFDPLFTTKQHGTGLGLSSVRSIIESHGGTISVKSPPTVFSVSLPQNPNKSGFSDI